MILTLGRGKAPLRGPRPVKPPALPEDTYWLAIHLGERGQTPAVTRRVFAMEITDGVYPNDPIIFGGKLEELTADVVSLARAPQSCRTTLRSEPIDS